MPSRSSCAVFIGRFQPYHKAHHYTVQQALALGHQVVMVVGSVSPHRTRKNPFSFEERQAMIRAAHADMQHRLHFIGIPDFGNDQLWCAEVKRQVEKVRSLEHEGPVHLIGHEKDQSTYYLKLFSEWEHIPVENYLNLSATPIRDALWQGRLPALEQVPPTTLEFLQQFTGTADYQALCEEK